MEVTRNVQEQMLTMDLAEDIVNMLLKGQLIASIRTVREWIPMDLKTAHSLVSIIRKEMVESYNWQAGMSMTAGEINDLSNFTEGVMVAFITCVV